MSGIARVLSPVVLALTAGLFASPIAAADPPAATARTPDEPLPDGAIARVGDLRFRHGSMIQSLIFLPEGDRLVSYSTENNIVRTWDVRTGRQLNAVKIEKQGWDLVFSPDGQFLVSQAADDRFEIRKVSDGKVVARPTVPTNLKWPRALSPGARWLASEGPDQLVLLRKLPEGKEVRTLKPELGVARSPNVVAFSPDGNALATGSGEGDLRVYDTATGKELWHYTEGESHSIVAITFSPEGGRVLTGVYHENMPGSLQEYYRLLRTRDGKLVRTIHEVPGGVRVHQLALGPGGRHLALSYIPGTGIPWGEIPPTSGGVKLWDLDAQRPVRLPGLSEEPYPAVAISRDGRFLATGDANGITVWDIAARKPLQPPERRGPVTTVAFSPDGTRLLAGDKFGLRLCDAATGRTLHQLPAKAPKATFTPDGRTVVGLWKDPEWMSFRLDFWDAATGRSLDRHRAWPGGTLSPDGRFGAWWDGDVIRVARLDTADDVARIPVPDKHAWGTPLVFSPYGSRLAWCEGDGEWRVHVWDVRHRREVLSASGHRRAVNPVVSPDGSRAAWISDLGIRIWDLRSDKETARSPVSRPLMDISLAFSPDGRLLASGTYDRVVQLWEVATGGLRRTFTGHRGPVTELAFSPDGKRLASGSSDTTVLVWDLVGNPPWPDDPSSMWAALAGKDAAKADPAIRTLIAHADRSLPWLGERFRDAKQVDRLAARRLAGELGSGAFTKRERAERELRRLGPGVLPVLREALREGPSPETKQRLERIAADLSEAGRLRRGRVAEALDRIGTPAAARLAQELSGEAE